MESSFIERFITVSIHFVLHVTSSPTQHVTSSPTHDVRSSATQHDPRLPTQYVNTSKLHMFSFTFPQLKDRDKHPGTSFNSNANRFQSACPEMCRCKKNVARCSRKYGNLTFVRVLPNYITFLIFSYNNLASINKEQFFSNVTNITGLDLSHNGLTFLCNGTFVPLVRLNTLFLDFNIITRDILRVVLSIKTLQTLSLNSSRLGPWIYDVLNQHPLPSLETLQMFNNSLLKLNFTVFSRYTNLKNICAGFCYISEVTPDNMPSLEYLDLFDNGLLNFPETCRKGTSLFPNLQNLILKANVLRDIPNVCLPNVTQLNLSFNRFTRFYPFTFSAYRFPRLLVLTLDGSIGMMKNVTFDKNAFSNPTLERISLANSRISFMKNSFDSGAFGNCPSLIEIQLDNNMFADVSELKFVKLFGHLTSLKRLHLGYCEIDTITDNTFKAVPFIQELYLYGNMLTSIPDGAFDHMTNLTVLSLCNNRLSLIRESTLNLATRQRIQHIYISNNPFICSCDIKWFQQWFISDKTVFDKTIKYQCSNLPNTSLADFYLPDQACLLSSDAFTLTVISVSLVFITLTVTAVFYRLRWHIRLLLYEAFRGRTGYRQHYLLTGHFQYDVFVSYASEDLDWVLTYLMPELEERMGVKLCIHQRDFLPGENIVDNIVDNLEKSKKVMLVFSTHFACNQWCQFELALCLQHVMDHDDILVIVCLENLPNRMLTSAMLALLKVTTYITWEDNDDARASFWGRIKIALHEVLP